MADSLGTLCIASAGGGSTTVTLVASGTTNVQSWGSVSITLASAVFAMCRPIKVDVTTATSANTICVVAGGQATAYWATGAGSLYYATAVLNSSGTTLALGAYYISSSSSYTATWEYNAFG